MNLGEIFRRVPRRWHRYYKCLLYDGVLVEYTPPYLAEAFGCPTQRVIAYVHRYELHVPPPEGKVAWIVWGGGEVAGEVAVEVAVVPIACLRPLESQGGDEK